MLKRLLAKRMDANIVEALIQSELSDLLALCQPEMVFLFGSASRGEMTDASDLDMLVVLKDDADSKSIKRRYYCRKKSHLVPVDMIFLTLSDFNSKAEVGGIAMICRQAGRLLYERA